MAGRLAAHGPRLVGELADGAVLPIAVPLAHEIGVRVPGTAVDDREDAAVAPLGLMVVLIHECVRTEAQSGEEILRLGISRLSAVWGVHEHDAGSGPVGLPRGGI